MAQITIKPYLAILNHAVKYYPLTQKDVRGIKKKKKRLESNKYEKIPHLPNTHAMFC